jgi:hypothetical protein
MLHLIAYIAACFASLRSILIVELMGLDKLTNAFGLLLLFQGIAAAIGSPLAGIKISGFLAPIKDVPTCQNVHRCLKELQLLLLYLY